jgi:hypothetical protein
MRSRFFNPILALSAKKLFLAELMSFRASTASQEDILAKHRACGKPYVSGIHIEQRNIVQVFTIRAHCSPIQCFINCCIT